MTWRLLPVGRTAFAKVDEADFARANERSWYVVSRGRRRTTLYAESGPRPQVMLHRFIVGDECAGKVVDHINGDGLDNRRCNLRVCTQRENSRNRVSVRGFRGVSWKKDVGKWRARIMVDRKEIPLGVFSSAQEAAAAYNEAAIRYFGEFAKLNVFGKQERAA